jgi:hypothetical protein
MKSEFVQAVYHEQAIEEYKNPLIEALPPICSKEEMIQKLSYYPVFDPNEREMEGHYRFHLIQRLFNLFQVFPQHLDKRIDATKYDFYRPKRNGEIFITIEDSPHYLSASNHRTFEL